MLLGRPTCKTQREGKQEELRRAGRGKCLLIIFCLTQVRLPDWKVIYSSSVWKDSGGGWCKCCHLNVASSENNRVHLVQRQLSCLGHLVLHKGEALQAQTHQGETESRRMGARRRVSPSHLVFHCDRVPGHVDAFDWSEWDKGLPDGVLSQLIVDGAHVHSTHHCQGPLTLSRHLTPADRKWSDQRCSAL